MATDIRVLPDDRGFLIRLDQLAFVDFETYDGELYRRIVVRFESRHDGTDKRVVTPIKVLGQNAEMIFKQLVEFVCRYGVWRRNSTKHVVHQLLPETLLSKLKCKLQMKTRRFGSIQ